MKSLLWKEWRENLKWAALPALFILLPMVLLGGPSEPLFGGGAAVLLYLIAAVFGAALGFLQIHYEARGDHRAILLHRPLSRSRIFLGKALAGAGIYLLALAIPFVAVEVWMATPGNMPAPYHWQTGLPWLADILAGLVYYFAGMLTAQREARWYGSRCLGVAAAFGCTLVVWSVPEFWQALVAIGSAGALVGVAAWGSFLTGGAYAPQPRLAKSALALTLLAGLLVVGLIGKLMIGQWVDDGRTHGYALDRKGRVLVVPWKVGVGPVGSITDLQGRVPPDLQGKRVDRNLLEEIEAPLVSVDWPVHQSYRSPGRFYVRYYNASTPGNEVWFYAPDQGRLLGYDEDFRQFLGSFGPDGFVPAGDEPGARFAGELHYPTRLWETLPPNFLVFPGGVYAVTFSRRTVQTLFTPAAGETVRSARWWKDRREKRSLAVVTTDRSIHLLTEAGAPVVSVPRVYGIDRYGAVNVGRLEDPERYVVWYAPSRWLEPEERKAMPNYLLEYDTAGKEIARRSWTPSHGVEPSPAQALFGLATPLPEAVVLVGGTRHLRAQSGLTGGLETWVLADLLEMWITYFIPVPVYGMDTSSGLFWGFTALSLLTSAACALACLLLARRYCFSRARCLGWGLCGFVFGLVGLLLMLALQEWPARIACPSCRRPRRVDRDCCEHCGAAHVPPAPDGTEIYDKTATTLEAALAGR
jgi:hypothetical protein